MLRAVCLLSGGPDGVIAAAMTKAQGYELFGLFVDYGQRTSSRERKHALSNAAWLRVADVRVAEVPFLGQIRGSAITDASRRVTQADRDSEYVPFRNTVLTSLAVAWAETLDAGKVVIGSIGGPWITPDNSPNYFKALNQLVKTGARAGIEVCAPLGSLTKAEVLRRGLELGIPLGDTWSCQNDATEACGECNNCLDRACGFAAIGEVDPVSATTER